MTKITVNNATIHGSFAEHLTLPENKRILFSAPFGSGKSYFLTEYFSENESFLCLTLYPVDYSIATNEDIFELVKYDIIDSIFEHFSGDFDLNEEDFSNLLIAQSFILNKLSINPILKTILRLKTSGADVVEGIEEADKVLNKYQLYKNDLKSGNQKFLSKFMFDLEKKKGSIRETDEITILINDFLNRIKEKHEGKPFVLIIDDLDRLDPDHVFRLFNIFTAHHDSKTDSNKFGFDKVILVSDINNLQYMFKHKYGLMSNFDGYIDKFYSYKPFYFDHRTFLKEKVLEYLTQNLQLGKFYTTFHDDSIIAKMYDTKSNFFLTLVRLCYRMIDLGSLRTRNFQRFKEYALPNKTLKVDRHTEYKFHDFPLLVAHGLMQQFFPRTQDLINAIQTLANEFESNYNSTNDSRNHDENSEYELFSFSIPFLRNDLTSIHRSDKDLLVSAKNEFGEKVYLVYNIQEDMRSSFKYFRFTKVVKSPTMTNENSTESALVQPNPYHFFKIALERAYSRSYITDSIFN